MKNSKKGYKRTDFIKAIVKYCLKSKEIRPREIYIFNVLASYGSYQVIIGPEYDYKECQRLHIKPHSRKLQINGTMHNLFLNPKHIAPIPDHEGIRTNLRGSVIMRNIMVHIVDQDGCGVGIMYEKDNPTKIHARQKINLAGEQGETMIKNFKSTGYLAKETYKIIQEDILKSVKNRR